MNALLAVIRSDEFKSTVLAMKAEIVDTGRLCGRVGELVDRFGRGNHLHADLSH